MDGLKCKCGGRLDLTTGRCMDCKKQCLQGIGSIMIGGTTVTIEADIENKKETREMDWKEYDRLFRIQ